MLLVALLSFAIFTSKSSAATEINDTIYCAKDLCPSQQKHIACGHSGNFDSSCPADRVLVNLTQTDIDQILDLHNSYRNLVASGEQTGLSAATKMKSMVSEILLKFKLSKWSHEILNCEYFEFRFGTKSFHF